MKKLLLTIFSFFIFPVFSFAVSNVNYKVSNYYIKANIQDNGDLKVKELIVLDGSFNGYERSINFRNDALNNYNDVNFEHSSIYNPSGIKDVSISAKYMHGDVSFKDIDDRDFDTFSQVTYANSGDKGKYIATYSNDGITYRMYYESNRSKVGFLVEYTLESSVVIHEDVAELYWQIFSDYEDNDTYRDLQVKVYLPGEDEDDTFRFWAHGPLSGTIDPIKSGSEFTGAYAYVSKLNSGEDFDIRMTFDKDLITRDYSLDHTYVNGFDEILEVEQARADEANKERKRIKTIYNVFKVISQIFFGLIIAGFITIKILTKKPKVDFEADYYREFIDDYNVEVIDYLYKKSLTPNALTAAIMNLVYLKKVKVEEIVDEKKKKDTDKKDYKFILLDRENLDASNTKLVEFLFDTVGNGTDFTTTELKKYASSLKTGSTFNKSYTSWNTTVLNNGKQQAFYKSKAASYIISIVLFAICFFIQILGAGLGVDFSLVYINPILGFVLILITIFTKCYSEKGALHIKKWNAFKHFLKDFGTFDVKELPEVALWERYLVYATIFGLAKKVQKDMNVKIKELGETPTFMDTYTNIYIYDSISSSFGKSVQQGKQQYAASRANAYSSSSSGGGFGGGFSGGGGFGGGGGGGHGF